MENTNRAEVNREDAQGRLRKAPIGFLGDQGENVFKEYGYLKNNS